MPNTSFSFPTHVDFGSGNLAHLPEHIRRFGGRAFVVTDPGVAQLPIFRRLTQILDEASVPWTATSEISPNPIASECEAGARALRESGANVVVGFGGGSALDGAKGIGLMANHAGRIVDYDDAKRGWERIRDEIAPIIAIPTTAGTGSEVGRSTVVVNPETNSKVLVFSPYLMPKVALVDAELTVGLPPWLTAATGFDALVHNLEALLATGYHPLADGIALEGISLVHSHLVDAFRNPEDLRAREGMAMAALMGATAFQKGLGAAHSLAHPLGTIAGLHHGLANAIVLPYVLAYNAPAIQEKMAMIRRRLDLKNGVADWIAETRTQVQIPHTLTEAGVSPALLEPLADQAIADPCHRTNPRPVSRDDLKRLYQAAFSGQLTG